jgi:hypothetical protein
MTNPYPLKEPIEFPDKTLNGVKIPSVEFHQYEDQLEFSGCRVDVDVTLVEKALHMIGIKPGIKGSLLFAGGHPGIQPQSRIFTLPPMEWYELTAFAAAYAKLKKEL